jgi:hypothetical protein
MPDVPIQHLYDRYRITPALQRHQYRVASVARYIAAELLEEHALKAAELQALTAAGLLHDMGNIIKFNFNVLPEFLEPEGRDYWERIKARYVMRYGADEHHATLQILDEIGVPARVRELVDAVGFRKVEINLASGDVTRQIVTYADMRVDPHGVVSLQERIQEGRIRWEKNHGAESDDLPQENSASYARCVTCFEEMEQRVFERMRLGPADVTDAAIAPVMEELREFAVVSEKTAAEQERDMLRVEE